MSEEPNASDGMLVKTTEKAGLAPIAGENQLVTRGLADISAAIDTAEDLAEITSYTDDNASDNELMNSMRELKKKIAHLRVRHALSNLAKGYPKVGPTSRHPFNAVVPRNTESEAKPKADGPSNE